MMKEFVAISSISLVTPSTEFYSAKNNQKSREICLPKHEGPKRRDIKKGQSGRTGHSSIDPTNLQRPVKRRKLRPITRARYW